MIDQMVFIEMARIYATAAHTAVGQLRKYTNDPYIVHPHEVAMMVKEVGGTPEMIAAAYLHDVVEDTHVKIVDIHREFGPTVASYVHWLTNPSQLSDGGRTQRKEIDRKFIASAPPEVKSIKLADLVSNTKSITEHDSKFAEIYLEEKRLLLEVLKEGNSILYARALSQIG